MSLRYERKSVYKRDLLGRSGRQYSLPWGPGKTMSTIQAAERIGVSDQTVRVMCEEGELEAYRIREKKGSPWLIVIDSVERYLSKQIARYDTSDPKPQPNSSSRP